MQKLSSELKKLISKLSERDQEGLSDEVLDKMYTVYPFNKYQHRASQLKADGTVVEGQIHIKKTNYEDFNTYKVEPTGMDAAIRKAAEREAAWAKGTATAKDMKTER